MPGAEFVLKKNFWPRPEIFPLCGIKLELTINKNNCGVNFMKRNKRTTVLAHEDLTPLTEHILTKMGKEGHAIRKRLKTFYRARAVNPEPAFEQTLDAGVLEAASQ
jgi:hypothetical protein